MSDLVGNPEDRFSRVAAHLSDTVYGSNSIFMQRQAKGIKLYVLEKISSVDQYSMSVF